MVGRRGCVVSLLEGMVSGSSCAVGCLDMRVGSLVIFREIGEVVSGSKVSESCDC